MISYRVVRQLLISANGRDGWRETANRTRQLRNDAYWTAKASNQPSLDRADLTITVHWPPTVRRRDRLNLAPTIKALVDGFISAGVLPDDDDTRIRSEKLITADDHCEPVYAAALDFDFQPITGGQP